MTIVDFLKQCMGAAKQPDPHPRILGYWANYEWMQNKTGEGKGYLFPAFENGVGKRFSEGDVVPMIRNEDGSIDWYKITTIHRPSPYYDGAPWDNGIEYDLDYDHTEAAGGKS